MRKYLFLLCLPFALAANPVFNGSFELGTDGFALEQELRTDLNKELKFHPLKTASARSPDAAHRGCVFHCASKKRALPRGSS